MIRTGFRTMLVVLPAALLWVTTSATPSAAAPSCPCSAGTAAFKSCVKSKVKDALKAAKKAKDKAARTALVSVKKAALKSSCARTKGPKKAIACCIPAQTTKDTSGNTIVTGKLCVPLPDKACSGFGGLGGVSAGTGTSCFPTNPCKPPASASGAFLEHVRF